MATRLLNYTYLKDYRAAYDDFYTLYQNVSYPISKARGSYWSARAADKLKDETRAQANYTIASRYPTTFYGQLAFANSIRASRSASKSHQAQAMSIRC